MDQIADAIIDNGQLIWQFLGDWANGHASATTNTLIAEGDTVASISSIFSDLVGFLAHVASKIIALI